MFFMRAKWVGENTTIPDLGHTMKKSNGGLLAALCALVLSTAHPGAMADAPMPSQPGGISYAFNGATFRGEYAVGGSVNFRLNTATPLAVGVGFSYAGNKNNGARVGVSGEF